MKLVTVVPIDNDEPSLKVLLKQTERRLRGKGTTLIRDREGRWIHAKYPGWIKWDLALGGILVAEIKSKIPDAEWKLLRSFIGYLERHLGEYIDSITISYR